MTKHQSEPPWEFLLSASRNSLQSYELTCLSRAANLRKEVGALLNQWLEESAKAMLARWLIEQRERVLSAAESYSPGELSSSKVQSESDNFLPDSAFSLPVNREAF